MLACKRQTQKGPVVVYSTLNNQLIAGDRSVQFDGWRESVRL
jgi:hypothetical protein